MPEGLDLVGGQPIALGQRRELALLLVDIVALVAVDDVGQPEALMGDDRAARRELVSAQLNVPSAPTSARAVPGAGLAAPSRTVTVSPVASVICDAMVRFQISSYTRASLALTSRATSSGERNESPAGRMASWASWAFLTFLA